MSVISHIEEHLKIIEDSKKVILSNIPVFKDVILSALKNSKTIFFIGNGGSSSDSQHLAAELIGRFSINRKPLAAVALTSDTSVLTCISNDFSYTDVFSRQIEGLAKKGDVLIALSTSGNSENVNRALVQANSMGVETIALLGKSGGQAVDIAKYVLVVPSESTARIQECHILIGHILCDLIEKELDLV